MKSLVAAAVLVALVACSKDKAAPKPVPTAVAILIDDKTVATTVGLTATPRSLEELVPGAPAAETWLAVLAFDGAGTATTVMAPVREHGEAPPALAVIDGSVRFGLARGGKLTDEVKGVTRVVIKTKDDRGAIAAELAAKKGGHGGGDSDGHQHDGDDERPQPTAELVIEVKTRAGEKQINGLELAKLPVIHAPTGDTQTPGWNVVDVIAAAGIAKGAAVTLIDSEGATLKLEAADYDAATTILYVKLNKSGQLRFRRFGKKGEAWEMTGELRGLARITEM